MNADCFDDGLLQAYADNELTADRTATVAAHIKGCDSCRDRLGDARELTYGVDALLASYTEAPDARAALVLTLAAAGATTRAEAATPGRSAVKSHASNNGFAPAGVRGNATARRRWGGPLRLAVAGVGLAAALLLAFWFSGISQPNTSSRAGTTYDGGTFLPAGKVRHVVYEERHEFQATGDGKVAGVGNALPDLLLTDLRTGKPANLSTLKGRPLVLHFISAECTACEASLSHVQQLYSWLSSVYPGAGSGPVFVTVVLGSGDTLDSAKGLADEGKYPWTFLYDAMGTSQSNLVGTTGQQSQVPGVYFIDANGVVQLGELGLTGVEILRWDLDRLLAPERQMAPRPAAPVEVMTDTEDVWLTAGNAHPMMYWLDKNSGCCPQRWTLVGEDAVWSYVPARSILDNGRASGGQGALYQNKVYKTSYDAQYLSGFVPNKELMSALLKQPNASSGGNKVVGGRETVGVEWNGNVNNVIEQANSRESALHNVIEPGNARGSVVPNLRALSAWPVVDQTITGLMGAGEYARAYNSDGTLVAEPTPTIVPVSAGNVPVVVVRPNVPGNTLNGLTPLTGDSGRIDLRVWFDKENYRVMRQELVRKQANASLWTTTRSIVKDEVLDAGSVSESPFKLQVPDGAPVEDTYYVFYPPFSPATTSPEATPMVLFGKR